MRRFLSASCCAIVLLQFLIAVPLVVCIAYFSAMADQLVQPPAGHSAVEWVPVETAARAVGPGQEHATADQSEGSQSLPSLAADLQPILEARLEQGSPLARSSLAPTSPGDGLRQFATALEHVAATAADSPLSPAAEIDQELPPIGTRPSEPAPAADTPVLACEDAIALTQSLQAAVARLYAQAQTLEADGRFDRADQIRELARALRAEIARSGADSSSENEPSPGLQPTVTEAAYNPVPPTEAAPPLPPPPVPTELRPADLPAESP